MEQNKSSIGSIIGTIVIIAIIILGGLYFWGKRIEESKMKQELVTDSTESIPSSQNEAAVIRSVTSGDDLDSIETDLNQTNLDNLNSEVNVVAE